MPTPTPLEDDDTKKQNLAAQGGESGPVTAQAVKVAAVPAQNSQILDQLFQEATQPIWENSKAYNTQVNATPGGTPPAKPAGYISRQERDELNQKILQQVVPHPLKLLNVVTGAQGEKYSIYEKGCQQVNYVDGTVSVTIPPQVDVVTIIPRVDANGNAIQGASDLLRFKDGKLVQVVGHTYGLSCVKAYVKQHLGSEAAALLGVGIGEEKGTATPAPGQPRKDPIEETLPKKPNNKRNTEGTIPMEEEESAEVSSDSESSQKPVHKHQERFKQQQQKGANKQVLL